MPRKLDRKLRAEARRRGFGAARTRRYVYGGLRRSGWRPRKK